MHFHMLDTNIKSHSRKNKALTLYSQKYGINISKISDTYER